MVKIAPSMLSADFARLQEEIKSIELNGGDLILKDTLNDKQYKYNIVKMYNDEMILRDKKKEGFDRLFYFKR